MLIRSVIFALAIFPSAMSAQTREQCARLSNSMLVASDGLLQIWTVMSGIDFAGAGSDIGGNAGDQIAAIHPIVQDIDPRMVNLLQALDDAAMELRRCAR